MNEKLLPFFRAVSEVNSGVFNRDVLIRHAVALAISDFANLPSSPVENTEVAFNTLVRLNITDLLAEFNEITPLNMANTTNLVRAYWKARYNVAFGVARSFSTGDFIGTVSGISVAVSPDELRILNESALDFDYLYQSARAVVESITGGAKENESFPKGDEQAVPSDLITPAIENYRDVCAQLKSIYGSSPKSTFGNYAAESKDDDDKKSLLKKIGEKIAAFFARIKEYIQRFWNWLTGKKKSNEQQAKEAEEFLNKHPDILDPDDKFVKPEFKKRGNGDVSEANVKSFKDADFIREEYRTSGEKTFEDLEKKIGIFLDAREQISVVLRKQASADGFRAAVIYGQMKDPVAVKYRNSVGYLTTAVEQVLKDIKNFHKIGIIERVTIETDGFNKNEIIEALTSFNKRYDVVISDLRTSNLLSAYTSTSNNLIEKFSSKSIPEDVDARAMTNVKEADSGVLEMFENLKKDTNKLNVNRILGLFDSFDLGQEQITKVVRLVAEAQQKIADVLTVNTRFIARVLNPGLELTEPILYTREKYEDVVKYIESIESNENVSDKTKKLIKDFQSGY